MSESARARIVEKLIQQGAEGDGTANAKTRRAKKAEEDGQGMLEFEPTNTKTEPLRTKNSKPDETTAEGGSATFGKKYTLEELIQARADALEGNMPIQDVARVKENARRAKIQDK